MTLIQIHVRCSVRGCRRKATYQGDKYGALVAALRQDGWRQWDLRDGTALCREHREGRDGKDKEA